MGVGPSLSGGTALMVLSTDRPVPPEVLARMWEAPGILDVHGVTSG
jgi:hypothetical protein